jgi:hypothetical protein
MCPRRRERALRPRSMSASSRTGRNGIESDFRFWPVEKDPKGCATREKRYLVSLRMACKRKHWCGFRLAVLCRRSFRWRRNMACWRRSAARRRGMSVAGTVTPPAPFSKVQICKG